MAKKSDQKTTSKSKRDAGSASKVEARYTVGAVEPRNRGGTLSQFLDAIEEIEKNYRPTGLISSPHK